MNKPVVALGSDLMRSLLELPKKAQKHATTFLTKFQVNPRSSGINLERIANAADEKLYSARIDQRYRAIIAFQKSSNVYVLLYVGDHDDAYKWAETKKLDVNPNTRAIQLYDMVSQEEIDTAMREDSQNEVGWGALPQTCPNRIPLYRNPFLLPWKTMTAQITEQLQLVQLQPWRPRRRRHHGKLPNLIPVRFPTLTGH